MQLDLFTKEDSKPDLLEELFQAYFDCRKNKRNTINALRFEKHFEKNIFNLFDEIVSGTYRSSLSIAFVLDKPVKREIFAADFRDRIVHHFIINRLNPSFEKIFIDDSYACRVGKGTHYGINRIAGFIKECSNDNTRDCYILKLDLQGFFLNINRDILSHGLKSFVHSKYPFADKAFLVSLCNKVIYNDPTKNCIIKGKKSDWSSLPKSKSLFHSKADCGLPIGNLTSQIFANFYLNKFDHFITKKLGIRYYGRYVDDFVIVHPERQYLRELIKIISEFLLAHLDLKLHPKKKYLQHYQKGVPFLGTVIKPNRIYISNRIKSNFYQSIAIHNKPIANHRPTKEGQLKFLRSMNSYLGLMKHYNAYRLRKKMLWQCLSPYWCNFSYLSGGYAKFVLKSRRSSGK